MGFGMMQPVRLLELLRGIHEAVLRATGDSCIYDPRFFFQFLDRVIVSELQSLSSGQNGKRVFFLPMRELKVKCTHEYNTVLESLARVDSLDHQYVMISCDNLFIFVINICQRKELICYYGQWILTIDFAIETVKYILQQFIELLNFSLIIVQIPPLHLLQHTQYLLAALQISDCSDLFYNGSYLFPISKKKIPISYTFSLIVHMLRSVERIRMEYSNLIRFNDFYPDLILSADPIDGLSDISDFIFYISLIIRIRTISIFRLPLSLLEVADNLKQVGDDGTLQDLVVLSVYVSDREFTSFYLADEEFGEVEVPHVSDEDGNLVQGDLLLEVVIADLIDCPTSLGFLSLECSHLDLLVVFSPCFQFVVFVESIAKQFVLEVGADEFLGEIEEGLPKSISISKVFDVFLCLQVYPILEEFIDSCQVYSTPGENILVEVAYHQKLALLASLYQGLNHSQLSWIAILKLIDYYKFQLIQIIRYFLQRLIPFLDELRSLHDSVIKSNDIIIVILFLDPLKILLEVLPNDTASRVAHNIRQQLIPFFYSISSRHGLLSYPLDLLLQIDLTCLELAIIYEPSGEVGFLTFIDDPTPPQQVVGQCMKIFDPTDHLRLQHVTQGQLFELTQKVRSCLCGECENDKVHLMVLAWN